MVKVIGLIACLLVVGTNAVHSSSGDPMQDRMALANEDFALDELKSEMAFENRNFKNDVQHMLGQKNWAREASKRVGSKSTAHTTHSVKKASTMVHHKTVTPHIQMNKSKATKTMVSLDSAANSEGKVMAKVGLKMNATHKAKKTEQPAGQLPYIPCNVPYWGEQKVYQGGAQIRYDDKLYEALYWTQGDDPRFSTEWTMEGYCDCTSYTPWTEQRTYEDEGYRVSYEGGIWAANWWTRGDNPLSTTAWTWVGNCMEGVTGPPPQTPM